MKDISLSLFFFFQDQLAQDPSAIDMFITGRPLALGVYSKMLYFGSFDMSFMPEHDVFARLYYPS